MKRSRIGRAHYVCTELAPVQCQVWSLKIVYFLHTLKTIGSEAMKRNILHGFDYYCWLSFEAAATTGAHYYQFIDCKTNNDKTARPCLVLGLVFKYVSLLQMKCLFILIPDLSAWFCRATMLHGKTMLVVSVYRLSSCIAIVE